MTLYLNKKEIYANSYHTNFDYLLNMTSLQVKALEEMEWDKYYIRILTDLGDLPWAFPSKSDTKNSTKVFIIGLNREIKKL
jgi:hypothetical protein